jgi:GNAT superfamily N-acetyltransferase/predicted nucleic acid-binding protein
MRKEDVQIVVLERFSDVLPHLNDVVAWADSEKNALGFFPAQVFTEQARKGNLLVAVTLANGGSLVYAGHLLFDARHSRAKVLQIFVKPEVRRDGAARRMLDRLKEHLTDLHFISIYANVAEDLREANAFWQQNGFYVQRTRPGGKTRNRTILVRCNELSSPQLFERSGITSSNPFGLDTGLQGDKPIYLLDLNVLFDLRPRRTRHEAVLDLFHAERHGTCQLALSAELKDELVRTAAAAPRSDPMHTWAAIFITFPLPPEAEKNYLIEALGALVFPDQARSGCYSANDLSDLTHLATAIHHRLTGFITSDEAILTAGKQIEAMFNVHVISPLVFQPSDELVEREEMFETSIAGTALAASPLPIEHEGQLRQMLLRLGISDSEVVSKWGAVDSTERSVLRTAVVASGQLAGYLGCLRQTDASTVTGRLAIDENDPQASGAGRLLLNKLLARARDIAPSRIRLQLAPRQVTARELAVGRGFASTEDGASLSKLVLNRIVTSENWMATVSELYALAQLKLPNDCPAFRDIDQQVEVICPDGNRVFVRLHEIESSLSPAVFCLPGRPAVITPIQRDFAEQLLEHSPQGSLLPHSRAAQYSERHYLSSEKTLKFFTRGAIMLFYESGRGGGAAAIVAAARVQRAYLKPEKAINQADIDPSVLNSETLSSIGNSKAKTVTAFDNLILLPRQVPLSSLQEIGCGKPNQLISTRPITSEQLHKILNKALSQ